MNLQMEINSLKQRIAELEELVEQEKEFPQKEKEFPQKYDDYWYVDDDTEVLSQRYYNSEYDEGRLSIDNIFKTKEQAEFAVEKLKVESELRKFSRPFKEDEYNYFIQIHPSHNNIVIESDDCYQTQGTIYFESTSATLLAIDTVGEYRIKKYIFGVED